MRLGPSGGAASAADALSDTNFKPADDLGGIGFGLGGQLYATDIGVDGGTPELRQIDPQTGALQRVIANASNGEDICPFSI